MRPAERLDLLDKIGRELQSRYTFSDIDAYLGAYGIGRPVDGSTGSKWVYSKQALRTVSDDLVHQIAADLGLVVAMPERADDGLPRNWVGLAGPKVFLSHLSKSKDKAARLKACLARYGAHLFVAHEDIQPTLEWQREIHRALNSMDCFLSLHTPGFAASYWCQQEVGYAVARGVKSIAIKMGGGIL